MPDYIDDNIKIESIIGVGPSYWYEVYFQGNYIGERHTLANAQKLGNTYADEYYASTRNRRT